jgi:hypothetical protein
MGLMLLLLALEGLLVGDGQPLTAFPAAAGQHAATISCRHSLTETVLVLSLGARRLIGAFHGIFGLKVTKGLQIWG